MNTVAKKLHLPFLYTFIKAGMPANKDMITKNVIVIRYYVVR